jgi:hypothetical protein
MPVTKAATPWSAWSSDRSRPEGTVRRADDVRIDRGDPQREGQDRQRGTCEHEQRAGLAIERPRLTRHGKRHAKTQQHEQEAPFGHEADAGDEAEEKCPSHYWPLGIGERGDEQRERRRKQRKRMGDAVVDLPAEPEEQHEREGKGGGKARARDRAQQREGEQNAGGCDQAVAQDEIGERPWTNELLHDPKQPFIERRVTQLVSAGETALQELGGECVLQGAPRRDTAQSINTKAKHQINQKAATPRVVSIWPASFVIQPSFVSARPLYTAADKRPAHAYKGAHAEVVRPKISAKNWLCQPGLPQGAGRFGAHHHQAARRRLRAVGEL